MSATRQAELHREVVGEGPPVGLVHAGICDSRMWDPQWETFRLAHRVVRYDMRGFGRSPLVPGRYSPPGELIALLDELALGPAALVGASMGGGISLQVAVARPDLVSALVLVGSGVRGHDELKGKLAIANAKLAYERYKDLFSGERWEPLAAKGATSQRCLWASTSTKNPAYRDVMYVEELIGPETVNTMPEETIRAFQDHGEVALTLEQGLDEAKRLFDQLAEAGIDYEDVVRVLEEEGVQKFADSFAELLDGIRAKRGELAAA